MLQELVVEGLGAIDRAEVVLGPGCSALTGETGAGKTLLVAAVSLLAGGRADRTVVRQGAKQAAVEGRWSIPPGHPAATILADHGLIEEGQRDDLEVVISRVVPADDRPARLRVNGRLTTGAVMAQVAGTLVEIAGQHEHQKLASPGAQRALLDSFAGKEAVELAARVGETVQSIARLRSELGELQGSEREREREIEQLRHEVQEIEAAVIEEGETEELKARAARLEHAEALAQGLRTVAHSLQGEAGAVDAVEVARKALEDAAHLDPSLQPLHDRLEALGYELADAAQEANAAEIAPDPAALAAARDRLAILARLTRKYGDTEREVLDYLERARQRLDSFGTADEEIKHRTSELIRYEQEAEARAGHLSKLRSAAATRLADELEAMLESLALAGARCEVKLEACELYEGGQERIEFLIAANPGETVRPLTKVASGGELSRVALALRVLTGTGTARTMVFDEVDAGVGGETAQMIGKALAQLADERDAQVLVVTHLPQVAAYADAQYRVAKESRAGRASVVVERVEGAQRVEELSRMLAGLPESDKARGHARELLELASRGPGRTR